MKKEYTRPMAEKLEFNYADTVTASCSTTTHGDMGIGNGHGGGCDHKPGHGNPHKPKPGKKW